MKKKAEQIELFPLTKENVIVLKDDKQVKSYRFVPITYSDGTMDHYRLMDSLPVRLSPEVEHAVKKQLFPGCRGVKSEIEDLEEAIKTLRIRVEFLKNGGEKCR